jgi:capsid portal protein
LPRPAGQARAPPAAWPGQGGRGAYSYLHESEFFNIKSVTRDDQLAAHRVPPQLMGILPNNAGGFGAVEPAARVFARNELVPLQAQFEAINEWAGVEVVRFAPYDLGLGKETVQ